MKKMIVAGECMVELSGPSHELRVGFGGDTLNTAIYASRLGGDDISVGYVTRLGTDSYSHKMRDAWVSEGLDCANVALVEGRTAGLYAIETDDAGERSFTYWRGESPARELFLGQETEQELAAFARADLVYVSGITLAVLSSTGRSNLLYAMHEAKSRGAMVACDANYRPRLWDNVDVAADCIADAYAASSVVFASDAEHLDVFGDRDREAVTKRLQEAGVSELVLRDGIGPITITGPELQIEMQVNEVAQPVDTTGAGDSFSGSYLGRRLCGDAPGDAVSAAMEVSRRVIQHRGAIIARENMLDLMPKAQKS